MADPEEVIPQDQDQNRNPDGTFKPGISGNPGGRPAGRSITKMLRERMEQVPHGQTKEWGEQIVEMLLEKVIVSKDVSAAKLILEYIEGKPKQNVEIDVNKENVDSLTGLLRQLSQSKDGSGTNSTPAGD